MPYDQPQFIEPLRLAEANDRVFGRYSLGQMGRLAQYLSDDQGHVDFKLQFGINESGLRFVSSNINAIFNVRCERCLEPFQLEIDNQSLIGIVSNRQEAKLLPYEYEPLLIEQDKLDLLEMIEDDILLCLPIAPAHSESDCPASKLMQEVKENDTMHPFAKLKILKLEK